MSLRFRQAAGGVLKRLRYRSPMMSSTSIEGTTSTLPTAGKRIFLNQYGSQSHTWSECHSGSFPFIFLCGPAVVLLGINVSPVMAEDASIELNDANGDNVPGFRKVEDGSVVSNLHTSKWRVFTDSGREMFSQGKLEDAERLFRAALDEAKEGFGQRDPHVASACNNLAELYRIKKIYDKAEPLYLEAVNILEESYGPDDIRVGAALHNLGKFYLVQRKLEKACDCYERALKIKRRVLGENHVDYADTMYHLGTLLHLQGKERDSEALIQASIQILEEGGRGESTTCIRRQLYLCQLYINSNHLEDAEKIQRKILHKMELSKGWNSLETVMAAENLALTLQEIGTLREAKAILQRCLDTRKSLQPADHIKIAWDLMHIASLEMLNFSQLKKQSVTEAAAELDSANDHLVNAIRISRQVLDKIKKRKKSHGASRDIQKDEHTALVILLESLDALALLETNKGGLQESIEQETLVAAENALQRCISAVKEYGSISHSPQVEARYVSCLRKLSDLIRKNPNGGLNQYKGTKLKELEDEIKCVEQHQISSNRVRS